MDLSVSKRDALSYAHAILVNAGLSTADLNISYPSPPFTPFTSLSSDSSPHCHFSPLPSTDPHEVLPSVRDSCYIPLPAEPYSPDEIAKGHNRINRLSMANAVIEHPANVIVEYPQTGAFDGERIAHVFTIGTDPNAYYNSLQSSFQYSLGNVHGGRKGIKCHLILDDTSPPILSDHSGAPVLCDHLHTSCKYLFIVTSIAR